MQTAHIFNVYVREKKNDGLLIHQDDLFAIQLSAEEAQHFLKSLNQKTDAQASISLLSPKQYHTIMKI